MKSYCLTINNKKFEVVIDKYEGDEVTAIVNGSEYTVQIEEIKREMTPKSITTAPSQSARVAPPTGFKEVKSPPPVVSLNALKAPIPGLVKKVLIKKGDKVTKGQKILVLEAMKLENEITAHMEGTIKDVLIKEGDSVTQDQVLVDIN